MKKTDLDFGHQERPWSFCIEANFSILRLKKIDQKGPELDIKQQFYTKSTPQNPMSWSVFPDHEVGRSFKLIFKITNKHCLAQFNSDSVADNCPKYIF